MARNVEQENKVLRVRLRGVLVGERAGFRGDHLA